MMDLPEFFILDVGHGNCSVLLDTKGSLVVDAPVGGTLLEALEARNIKVINKLVISHADVDHIGGVTNLLVTDKIVVEEIYVNPDAIKATVAWSDFRSAIQEARTRKDVRVKVGITSSDSGCLDQGEVTVEILSPFPEDALGGVGGKNMAGKTQTANSLSVVIRLIHESKPIVLLPADLDEIGFGAMLKHKTNCEAQVLVFPHHGGGIGGGNLIGFAEAVSKCVSPETVVFSIGRGKYKNPHPDIVKGVKLGTPNAHIFCTQLSEHCSKTLPSNLPVHLNTFAARGKGSNSCCGGTFAMNFKRKSNTPDRAAHGNFVNGAAPQKLC